MIICNLIFVNIYLPYMDTLDCSIFQDGSWYFALQLVREYHYTPRGPAQGVLTTRTVRTLWNTDSAVPGVMKSDMIDNWESLSPQNVNTLYLME